MKRTVPFFLCMAVLCLQACSTHSPEIKAPCDYRACHDRVNVNTWYKGQ